MGEKWTSGLVVAGLFLLGLYAGQYVGLSPSYAVGLGLVLALGGSAGAILANVTKLVTGTLQTIATAVGLTLLMFSIFLVTAPVLLPAARGRNPIIFILIIAIGSFILFSFGKTNTTIKWLARLNIIVGILAAMALFRPVMFSAGANMVAKAGMAGDHKAQTMARAWAPSTEQSVELNGRSFQRLETWLTRDTLVTLITPTSDIYEVGCFVESQQTGGVFKAKNVSGRREIYLTPYLWYTPSSLLDGREKMECKLLNHPFSAISEIFEMETEEVKTFSRTETLTIPPGKDHHIPGVNLGFGDEVRLMGYTSSATPKVFFAGKTWEPTNLPSSPLHNKAEMVRNLGSSPTTMEAHVNHPHPPGAHN